MKNELELRTDTPRNMKSTVVFLNFTGWKWDGLGGINNGKEFKGAA